MARRMALSTSTSRSVCLGCTSEAGAVAGSREKTVSAATSAGMTSTSNVVSTTTRNVDTTMGITITMIDIIRAVNSIVLPRTNLYQLQRKILQPTRTAMLETVVIINILTPVIIIVITSTKTTSTTTTTATTTATF
ncbi:hypothetical protein RRG08_057430 [Elysia crispata]|uniref:Uncharacterized protein n=1 Tax=Elysia crispata TaxID=231223 RepID=A0AAE0Z5D4_9GAST|nr:hypothetical protein RRG08_057430 [Elysia crispata]